MADLVELERTWRATRRRFVRRRLRAVAWVIGVFVASVVAWHATANAVSLKSQHVQITYGNRPPAWWDDLGARLTPLRLGFGCDEALYRHLRQRLLRRDEAASNFASLAERGPDMAVFALAATVQMLPALLLAFWLYSRGLRRPNGRGEPPRCWECGYILKGLATPRCPECGTPI